MPHTTLKSISPDQNLRPLGRRAFLQQGALVLTSAAFGPSVLEACWKESQDKSALQIGLLTDLHYADKPAGGSRHYRLTPEKLKQCRQDLETNPLDFVVELGDFIDAADSVEEELAYLKTIDEQFRNLSAEQHRVLGNHCVYTLTKEEFLSTVEQEKSYYSFDRRDFHFVVLDACFTSDGTSYGRQNFRWTDPNIPVAELEWLRKDLKNNDLPTIAFVHQRLDVDNHYGVNNAEQVRHVLEQSGNVLAVFQGHNHVNAHQEINGIHYCTLQAMVEGAGPGKNAYARMTITPDQTIRIEGFHRQDDYQWSAES